MFLSWYLMRLKRLKYFVEPQFILPLNSTIMQIFETYTPKSQLLQYHILKH